ncbi:Uncharacterized protein HA466_0274760 [Hirschfeldia incana]|nr:Uncharacterized protein HA466_0274760 [Hirschfeldia incana]
MMSSSWEIQLMETAKEELEILQAQYPNRFAYLKSDLQSFISNLHEDHAPPSRSSSSPLVLTQGDQESSSQFKYRFRLHTNFLLMRWTESSNCNSKQKHKKRKYTNELFGDQASSSTGKIHKNNNHKMGQRLVTKRKTRVEMVLERAQLCLQKIRDVKASLC